MTKLWENSNPAASILLLNQEIMVAYCNSVIVVITVSYCKIDNCKTNSNILATLLPVFCCLFEGQFVPVQYEPWHLKGPWQYLLTRCRMAPLCVDSAADAPSGGASASPHVHDATSRHWPDVQQRFKISLASAVTRCFFFFADCANCADASVAVAVVAADLQEVCLFIYFHFVALRHLTPLAVSFVWLISCLISPALFHSFYFLNASPLSTLVSPSECS